MLLSRTQAALGASLALAVGACTCSGPKLVSISPKSARAGGAAFTLTITGQDLGSATKVVWGDPNGRVLQTTRVDRGHATAEVAAEDIASPGVIEVHLSGSDSTGSADFRIVSAAEVPVARICADVKARVGAVVQLDGSCSISPTGAALAYAWTFTRVPAGSAAVLDDPAGVAPTFTADAAGDYELKLVVAAGDLASDPAVGKASTSYVAPVANAGRDKVVPLGATVALDGAKSTDVNGGPLTYTWTFASKPDGSAAELSNPNDVRPRFVADKAGTYELELIVADAFLPSSPSRVRIGTSALPPVADAGKPQGVAAGATVQLDGSDSFSPSGAALSFRWALIGAPAGSAAALANPSAVHPTFAADASGTYVAQLIVNDGTSDSAPATVRIATGAVRPMADPGAGQTVGLGGTARLDGSRSSATSGRALAYHWSLLFRPAGSQASLSGAETPAPSFAVDQEGTYVAQLIVDDGIIDSFPATVVIGTGNTPPVASAGAAQTVDLGAAVALDGSASSDVDGDALTFQWTLAAKPEGSSAALSDPTSPRPTFTADRPGTFIAQLIVNDGRADSAPSSVAVTVIQNHPPLAKVGADQTLPVGSTVQLDGTGSSDPDGDPLAYRWTLTSKPTSSQAALSDSTASKPTFVLDQIGSYSVQLIANDGKLDSPAATGTVTATPKGIVLALVATKVVGVSRPATATATLSLPAPAGGVAVSIASSDTAILTVGAPSIAIPEGQTTGQVTLDGISPGKATLTATAEGYVDGKLDVTVTLNLISVPVALNVGLGQTTAFPVTIAPNPAPAGGVVVTLATADPNLVGLVDAAVTIPQGALSANATVRGVAIGSATVTATNPNYATASSKVTTTASFVFSRATATLYKGLPPYGVGLELQVAGVEVPAPSGGVDVALSPADPTCLSATAAAIAAGTTSTIVRLDYGGTAKLPCTTKLTATSPGAPGISAGSITVTVQPQAPITFNVQQPAVGAGLATSVVAYLGASNHGGVTLHLASADPSRALLAKDNASAGAAGLDFPIADGNAQATFWIHALEDQSGVPLSVPVTASAPGFIQGTANASVVAPGLDLSVVSATTTFAKNVPLEVRTGVPAANLSSLTTTQPLRFGGPGLTVTVTTDAPTAGILVAKSGQGASETAFIAPQQSQTPSGAANGGIELEPLATGTVHLAASAPGLISTAGASRTVTISAPNITWSSMPVTVGAGLQTTQYSYATVYLGASNHGGTTIHLASSNPQAILLAKDWSTAGSASIDLPVAVNGTSATFSIVGLETAPSLPASSTITATCPGFNAGTATATAVQAAFDLSGVPSTATTLSVPSALFARVGVPASNHASLAQVQNVRQGGAALAATLSTSDPGIAKIGTSAAAGASGQVSIAPGQYQSPGTLAQGGANLVPAGGGKATISASIPGLIATAEASRTTVVSAPTFSFSSLPHTVGIGLQVNTPVVYLSNGSHGGVTVHVESADPSRVRLAQGVAEVPTGSIDVPLANGATSFPLRVAAMEGSLPGTVNIAVSAPGFTPATTSATLVTAAYELMGVPTNTTTLSSPASIMVRVGVPAANNTLLSELQSVRSGGAPLTATIANSVANVAQLLSRAPAGQTASTTIDVGQNQSPSAVVSGGVSVQKLTAGTTTVSASIPGLTATAAASRTMTVSTPSIGYSNRTFQLGAGLQDCCWTVNLGASEHGGVTVHIASSDPTKVLVAPNAISAGAPSLDIPLANGVASTTFGLMALETASPLPSSVAITSSAQGFTDGTTTLSVLQPAVDLVGLPTSIAATAANAPFSVRVGSPNSAKTGLSDYQAVRIGGQTLTATVTNSSSAVAQLATQPTAGQAATVQIPPGSYQTKSKAQGGIELDPLAAGSTTVSAGIPGFVTLPTSQASVTVKP